MKLQNYMINIGKISPNQIIFKVFFRKTTAKIIAAAFLSMLFANIISGQTDARLKQEIEQALKEEGLTGAVWSVVDSDGKIASDTVGIKNLETNEFLKATDKVHIGSVTKTILAVGILRLVSENKIDLDAPVNKYLPEIDFQNEWNETNPVTVRHLLDHTSGLEDMRLWQMFTAEAAPNSALAAAFPRNQKLLKIRTQPGTVFSYSNMGYTLLGMIIEKVANEPYENYLDENFLKPLGMRDSTFGFVSQIGDKADFRLAMGHLDDQSVFPALPVFLRPASQFTTTADDMGLFLKFIMSDGSLGGQPFVKTELLRQMGQPHETEAKRNGLQIGYGLGISKRDRHGVVGLAHSGNIVGYHAMIYAFPESGKAFFISHNTDSESANYERFNEILIKYLNLSENSQTETFVNSNEFSDWEGYFIPLVSRFETLSYLDVLTGFTKVTVEDDKVVLSPFQKSSKELFHKGNGLFLAKGKITNSHVFYKTQENEPVISDGLSSLKKINGFYLLCLWTSFVCGVIGLLFLLASVAIRLFIDKGGIIINPVFPAFLSIMLLFIPIPFFLFQSFISIGDLTLAGGMSAIVTLILPFGLLASAWLYFKNGTPGYFEKLNFLAIAFSFQWVLVLAFWGLIPLILWR